jgi:3-phosphoshikimate 1-carboxyvinyltransferase
LTHDPQEHVMQVDGCDGNFPATKADLFLANSGTSIRFLTSLVALGQGTYTLDGIERMRQRPIGDLIGALGMLGVDVAAVHHNDCPPIVVRAAGIPGGEVSVRGNISSQFLSSLLMAAPLAKGPISIHVDGPLVSQPYVDMTLAVMTAFGAQWEHRHYERFTFSGRTGYRATDYAIEPDASAASYFFAAAAITGGQVTVRGLGVGSLQGDLRFVYELERMGCMVEMRTSQTAVIGGRLHGIDADLADLSDTVPTLAVVACFADSPTRIRNVKHIRRKETDRIAALVTELRKSGVAVKEFEDGLLIEPGPMRSAAFDTYNDHRMAMSLSLLGLRVPGIVIRDPGCTAKTYPEFFSDLTRLAY